MAAEITSSISALTPAPDNVGRLHSHCRTAADVQVRAARVRAFRAQVFKPEPLPASPAPTLPVPPVIATKPVELVERMKAAPAVPGRISVRQVLEATAEHFGTTAENLTTHSRKQPIVRRRQLAMYVARNVTGRSLPFIARKMGRKDHTTALHAWRVIDALLDAGDVETAAAVKAIVEQVTGGANG